MNILSITIIILIFFEILWITQQFSKRTFCMIAGLLVFGLIGLRSVTTGGDTEIYMYAFERVRGMSLSQAVVIGFKDKGYTVLEWIVAKLNGSFRHILMLNGLVFSYSISKYIYRYSDDAGLSYILLFSFNILQFSLSGIRQTFAMSIILLALMAFQDEKYVKSIFLYIIAVSFHQSSMLTIVIVPLALLARKKGLLLWSVPIILVVFIRRVTLATILATWLNSISDRIGTITEGGDAGLTTALVVTTIYFIGIFCRKKYLKKYDTGNYDFAMMFFAVIFESLVVTQAIFFRIAFYALISCMIFVPRIISVSVDKKMKPILTILSYGIALIMCFGFTLNSVYGGYRFFWN